MERTEEDKLLKAAITVTLGGMEYSIAPLVIKDAREWRKMFSALMRQLPGHMKVTSDNEAAFENAVTALIVGMPDEMTDLFFAYAKDLDRETIETTASEIELAKAFEEVVAIAFPLLGSLTGALGKIVR